MAAKKINGRNLSLMFDGTTEFSAAGTAVTLDNEEGDTDSQTFEELSEGAARQWFIQLTARADYTEDELWRMLWDNSGQDITFLLKPEGNAVASASQPHFSGTATVLAKPPVGGTAGENWTFEARLDVVGEPALVTGP